MNTFFEVNFVALNIRKLFISGYPQDATAKGAPFHGKKMIMVEVAPNEETIRDKY